MKNRKKNQRAILYQEYLTEKKPYGIVEEVSIGELFFTVVKNTVWMFWHILEFLMIGIAVTVLLNDSTRRALLELFYYINK
ncbi:MAG: hypothetical protein RSD28_07450 [Lachnospiraceae bacterium]